jgi:hypothetical protein
VATCALDHAGGDRPAAGQGGLVVEEGAFGLEVADVGVHAGACLGGEAGVGGLLAERGGDRVDLAGEDAQVRRWVGSRWVAWSKTWVMTCWLVVAIEPVSHLARARGAFAAPSAGTVGAPGAAGHAHLAEHRREVAPMARLDRAMADPAGIDDRDDAPLGEGVLLARRAQVQVVLEQQPQHLPAVRILRVDAGLLGTMPAPVGPDTQRYGAGNPWPWDRFGSGSGR